MTDEPDPEAVRRLEAKWKVYGKRRRNSPRPRDDGNLRFEWYVFGEWPFERWRINKIAYGARNFHEEVHDEEECERIVAELRSAGYCVDEFKPGVVEGPHR